MEPDIKNNIILEPDRNDGRAYYRFRSPYEINVDDCVVKGIVRDRLSYIIHIDISETAAQSTLSEFITNVAASVGINKTITVNNIALNLNMDAITMDKDGRMDGEEMKRSEGGYLDCIKQNPQMLRECTVNVTFDWPAFTVDTNMDMGVNLILTRLHVHSIHGTCARPDVLKIIQDTTPKPVDPSLVPKLYENVPEISIQYCIIEIEQNTYVNGN